jgi:hypothetical protein
LRSIVAGYLVAGAVLGWPFVWITLAQSPLGGPYRTAESTRTFRRQMIYDDDALVATLVRLTDEDAAMRSKIEDNERQIAVNTKRLNMIEKLDPSRVAVLEDEVKRLIDLLYLVLAAALTGLATALFSIRRTAEVHRQFKAHRQDSGDYDVPE